MMMDRIPVQPAKRRKIEEKSKIIGWKLDLVSHEIMIEREDGSEDRLYEDVDLRQMSNA
jgi:hypothetical protein